MISDSHLIPADKIDPIPFSEGSRVRVHRLRGRPELEGRLIRVPKDSTKDPNELVQIELLKLGPLADFLPMPEFVRAEVGGQIRCVVSSLEIKSTMCRELPSAGSFNDRLQTQSDLGSKIAFLHKVRAFIDACKNTYWRSHLLPDLVGRGNIAADGEGVWLLDSNNISGKWRIGGEVEVPLDDQGLPIFDMGLRLMHSIEKTLLTNCGTNFSTETFNRAYRKERPVRGQVLPDELKSVLVSKEDLKKDPFYGALRFGARREEVRRILDRHSKEWFIH